jgi:hypothetical protein
VPARRLRAASGIVRRRQLVHLNSTNAGSRSASDALSLGGGNHLPQNSRLVETASLVLPACMGAFRIVVLWQHGTGGPGLVSEVLV